MHIQPASTTTNINLNISTVPHTQNNFIFTNTAPINLNFYDQHVAPPTASSGLTTNNQSSENIVPVNAKAATMRREGGGAVGGLGAN
jgi:hypothetical protein